MTIRALILGGLGLLTLTACNDLNTGVYREGLVTDSGEPAYITVQQCLIGVAEGMDSVDRPEEEAEILARELHQKAVAGEDFDAIVREHSDDAIPGIWMMANHGFPGDSSSRLESRHVLERGDVFSGIGDTAFSLKPGEVGLVPYDKITSRLGWHIIKRLK